MRTVIAGGTVVTPFESLPEASLVLEGDRVAALLPAGAPADGDATIDARGLWVTPGLIDIHIHGCGGFDTMDATPEALQGLARFQARHGVTAYLPTTPAASAADFAHVLRVVGECQPPDDGARPLGVHLEGPYLNPEHRGAQPPAQLRPPDPAEYRPWFDSGLVRLMTLAPELPGGLDLIDEGRARGIEFAVGHSGADYATLTAAADHGLRQATHTFNGMLGLHHREPGTVGGVLADDRIYAQVIADGVHVHPAVVKLLVRAKGAGRVVLITDSMRAAGLADGTYQLAGQPITVRDGVARTSAGGLAGSTITLDAALRNVLAFAGISLAEGLRMATSTPAEAMGWAGRKGVLAPGADADVVLLDRQLQVRLTIVGGRVVHRSEPSL